MGKTPDRDLRRATEDSIREQGKRDFVSESSSEQVNDRAIVIQRAGELSEFVQVLETLAVPVEIHRGARMPTADQVAGASVVIVPGTRLLEGPTPNLSLWPNTLAIADHASKTMLAQLSRVGASLVIRRPIHPRTLRLVLLHQIYRGPERRRRRRTLIGHPVRVGTGLFKQRATLLELSDTGARIELPKAPKVGSKLTIVIGKDLTLGKPLKLQANILRSIRASGENGRAESVVGVALLEPRKHRKAVVSILDRFASGPASWNGKVEPTAVEATSAPNAVHAEPTPEVEEIDFEASARRLPPARTMRPPPVAEVEAEPIVESEEAAEIGDTATQEADPDERRSDPRIPYGRRVVALGEEAARILVGRDLSHGGMRIARTNALDVGDTLRVVLHCGTELEPLVVLAKALRDDGEAGVVLGFPALSDGQRDHLEKIIASSSPIRVGADETPNGKSGSVVMGEMLETISKAPPPPKTASPVESDEQIDAHLDDLFDT